MAPLTPATTTLRPDEPLPRHLRASSSFQTFWAESVDSLNFYRLHMLYITFTPLIFSGIMYGANGQYKIAYIDCLFNCVSAMAVCGLAASNLSTLTGFQQTLLFVQMLLGSPIGVSVIMIAVRRHFFRVKFKHIIEAQNRRRELEEGILPRRTRRLSFFTTSMASETTAPPPSIAAPSKDRRYPSNAHNEDDLPTSASSSLERKDGNNLAKTFNLGRLSFITRIKTLFTGRAPSQDEAEARIRQQMAKRERKDREKRERERTAEGGRRFTRDHAGGLKAHMIRRVEGEVPMLVNQTGHQGGVAVERPAAMAHAEAGSASEGEGREESVSMSHSQRTRALRSLSRSPQRAERTESPEQMSLDDGEPRRLSAEHISAPASPNIEARRPSLQSGGQDAPQEHGFPRSKTIAFDPNQINQPHLHGGKSQAAAKHLPRTGTIEDSTGGIGGRRITTGAGFERTLTRRSQVTQGGTVRGPGLSVPRSQTVRSTAFSSSGRPTKLSGFGGFPMPHEIIRMALAKFFPKVEQKITRTLTMQPTATFASIRSGTGSMRASRTIGGGLEPVPVPYISFDAVVGRNSHFKDLSEEQMEELGGVEYRALKVLTWIVPLYFIVFPLTGFIIIWPYINAKGRYDAVFEAQPRLVPIGWFSAFQVVSAFSNTGMSLVDTSMIPFQTAYLMIAYIIILILAGNTAYPVFLRFTIWVISKCTSPTSRLHETTRFLLDHPRRCYVYLFPSHQTFFLLSIVIIMTLTDWVSFLVLDIGTPVIEAIPVGTRIAAAFLQSAAVRAAGFAIVPLNSLAPAVKVLYAIMMYISVYPIAMSVRATNVYEERSLGVFDNDSDDSDEEEEEEELARKDPNKVVGWSRYLAFHARRQLAFDIWWLALALWLVCIIERSKILDPATESFFNIFNIMFELISGYGTVGLSLGIATANYSLSGDFSTLSKLVVCLVMIRGRHRGLPVAIDRAVMLPNEFEHEDNAALEETRTRRSRRSSLPASGPEYSRHERRESNFSFHMPRPTRPGATSAPSSAAQPWLPEKGPVSDQDESALADDDEPASYVLPPPRSTASHQLSSNGAPTSSMSVDSGHPDPPTGHDHAHPRDRQPLVHHTLHSHVRAGDARTGGALTPVREVQSSVGGHEVGEMESGNNERSPSPLS